MRLSTKRSIHNAIFEKLSPLHGGSVLSPHLFSDSDQEHGPPVNGGTGLHQNEASPMLIPRLSSAKSNCSDLEETKIYQGVLDLQVNHMTFNVSDESASGNTKGETVRGNFDSLSTSLQIDRFSKSKASVRRSARISAIKATQWNFQIHTGTSPATSLCKKKKDNAAFSVSK